MDFRAKEENVTSVQKRPFKGHVYNVTTETGNLFVENILVHNSGGLGTPPHLRVEPGMIHKASGGVLFVDEIATLSQKSQQELLTAMQEKKYPITGQSEMSSGAMTRTEPIPCFPAEAVLSAMNGKTPIGSLVDSILSENQGKVKVIDGVETFDLEKEHQILAYSEGKIVPSKLQRVYRRKYSGKVLKIKFDDGTELIATPEHPIKTLGNFIKADDLRVGAVVEAEEKSAISEGKNIIQTYSNANQLIAKKFAAWLSSEKSLSHKELGVDSKTVYLWKRGAMPRPLKAARFLNSKNLLPLAADDARLPIIARVAGALFGDGGLDGRRFARIYFVAGSDELADINEFKEDLLAIFGRDIEPEITIRKSVSKTGSGLELSVNNSFIARFFYALGVPKGDKVSQPLKVPSWINGSDILGREFFSSLLTCELYGGIRSSQDTPKFVMAKIKDFEKEHFEFLNCIRGFLSKNGVEVGEARAVREYTKNKNLVKPKLAATYSFSIKPSYKNIIRLSKTVNFYYAYGKRTAMLEAVGRGEAFVAYQGNLRNKKQQAVLLRQDGKTIRQIAAETRLQKNTVLKLVAPTYKKYSEDDKSRVFELFKQQISPKAAAKTLQIPYTTVLYWKNNYYGGGQ